MRVRRSKRKSAVGRADAAGAAGAPGNQALQRLLQMHPAAGHEARAPDPFEREAERVADRVTSSDRRSAHPQIRRLTSPMSSALGDAGPGIERSLAGAGRPLEPGLREEMEQRFGHDFSRVRTHAGSEAERSARELGAEAYAAGYDLVFARDPFAGGALPLEGRRLVAHELTHVVQQAGMRTALQMQPDAKKKAARAGKTRVIVAIHAEAGTTEGATATIIGEKAPLPIVLERNDLPEGTHRLTKRDVPGTPLVEFEREGSTGYGFRWQRPEGVVSAERVVVVVGPAEFSFEEHAQAEFDAVPERIMSRLTKKGARRLETPEEKLGFANFARELQRRGVTDEELALFYERAKGAADPRRKFDWTWDWPSAVDQVIGGRAALEKKAEETTERFQAFSSNIPDIPADAYKLYRMSQVFPDLRAAAKEELAESGIDIEVMEANREFMMEEFDARLRLETNAALDRFEGGLLLTRERYIDDKGAKLKIAAIREAAQRPEVTGPKAVMKERKKERDSAEQTYMRSVMANSYSPSAAPVKEARKLFEEADQIYVDARVAYLTALQKASGIPVPSWRGLDVEKFFYGSSADRSYHLLSAYIWQTLRDVARARKELAKDKGTIYKADMMVQLTKDVLGITPDSTVDKLVDQRVEENASAPWWERLLDILSLALIFIPGGAVVTAVRFGVGVAQTISAIDNEALSETLARAEVRQEGGSAFTVGMSVVGSAADLGDVVKVMKGGSAIIDKAADVERAIAKTTDAATTAGAKAEHAVEQVAEGASKEAKAATEIPPAPLKAPEPELPPRTPEPAPPPKTPEPPPPPKTPELPPPPKTPEAPPPPKAPEEPPEPPRAPEPEPEVYGPKHDKDFGDIDRETRQEVPEATGPVTGQKMGQAVPGRPVQPPARTFTDEEIEALKAAETRLAKKRKAEVLADLEQRRPEVYKEIIKKGRLQSRETISDFAARDPQKIEELYADWVKGRARKRKPIKSSFARYVKRRFAHARGQAGEAEDAFVRGADEIMVKAPKSRATARGSDSMTYQTKADRVRYRDNKAFATGAQIEKVSALEKNLIHNLKEDINDIERYLRSATDVPPEIANKVLPRLKDALAELEEYVAKHPPGDAYAADVRDAFDSILRNNGIDRVVTFAGAGPGVSIAPDLAGKAGFKVD